MADNGVDSSEPVDSTDADENKDCGRRLSCGRINQLFAACDLNGSGFIEQEELHAICNELTSEELADVFKLLDNDEDGKISLQEFADGFQVDRGVFYPTFTMGVACASCAQ